MIVVTHEMRFARKVADRVIFMDGGEIVEDAKKEDFFGQPRSERAQLFLSKILSHLGVSHPGPPHQTLSCQGPSRQGLGTGTQPA